jgi:hypothetical protein
MRTAKLTHVLEPPWLQLEPLRLGDVPAGIGTPFAYVLIAEDEKPVLRLDVYPGLGCFFAEQAIIWNGFVAVGLGTGAFLVNLRTRTVAAPSVDGYFSGFWSSEEVLLVIDATGITRVGKDGGVQWSNRDLAVDGVEVGEVKDGFIHGRGCMDPPEKWKAYALSLETGRTIAST